DRGLCARGRDAKYRAAPDDRTQRQRVTQQVREPVDDGQPQSCSGLVRGAVRQANKLAEYAPLGLFGDTAAGIGHNDVDAVLATARTNQNRALVRIANGIGYKIL